MEKGKGQKSEGGHDFKVMRTKDDRAQMGGDGEGGRADGRTFLLRVGISHLPDTDDGVGNQDKQNDKRLHEGRDRIVIVLEKGQNLKNEDQR